MNVLSSLLYFIGQKIGSIQDDVSDINDTLDAIGTVYEATSSKAITTADIDVYTVGPSVTLPKGKYVIVGRWTYNSGSSVGARNLNVVLSTNSGTTSSGVIASQRVYANGSNFAVLQATWCGEFNAQTTIYLKGSSSMTYTSGQNQTIRAIKIA